MLNSRSAGHALSNFVYGFLQAFCQDIQLCLAYYKRRGDYKMISFDSINRSRAGIDKQSQIDGFGCKFLRRSQVGSKWSLFLAIANQLGCPEETLATHISNNFVASKRIHEFRQFWL